MIKRILFTSLLTIGILHAEALMKPMLQVAYDFGGTTLATIDHSGSYYYDASTKKIKAGQGLSFEAGASVARPDSLIEMQFLIGYKFDSDSATNGDITWDVIPFTALAMFKSGKWKFGGGATYHLNPSLSGGFSGTTVATANGEYDNAFGGVVQVQYMASKAFAIGLRGTFIEYKLKSNPTLTASGNSIGIVGTYTFGHTRSRFR